MTIDEFAQLVPGLSGMSHVDRIKHFVWFVLTQEHRERVVPEDIRRCYDKLSYAPPTNLLNQINQMVTKKAPDLLMSPTGFRLERRIRDQLDAKYASRPAAIAVDAMLQALPGKVSDEAERLFLSEAIVCYRSRAFRATIVMSWNLAYDHLLAWIVANNLTAFNGAIGKRFPKKAAVTVAKQEDFGDEFREFDVIEICGTAGIIPDNMKKILHEKLTKRNMAAHPSLVEITQYQAEDVITDLVNNVILKLS